MSTPLHALINGTFTTPATLVPIYLSLPCGYDEIEIFNVTDFADAGATTQVMRAKGYSFLPAGSAFSTQKTNGAATMGTETMTATGGFTYIPDSGLVGLGAPVVNATGITRAAAAVVTSGTLPANGQVVRMYNTTGMLQISGMDFTVDTSGAGTFNLAYLDSQAANGFDAAATANSFRIVPFDPRYYPRRRFITKITAANPAVITLSVTHGFTVGQKVRIIVPRIPGNPVTQTMIEMDGLLATITAINTTTNTITTDIDSSAFTPFHFPTSAESAVGWTPATVVPVGEAAINTVLLPFANLLDDATINKSFTGVMIGTGVLVASKTYGFIARRGLDTQTSLVLV